MSQLKKRIDRLGRAAPGSFGFARVAGQRERALLLGAVAGKASEATTHSGTGVDLLIARASSAAEAGDILAASPGGDSIRGAWMEALSEGDASALKDTADFVVSAPDTTAAAAVDSDRLGHVLEVTADADDSFLRSLGPLGLDALLVRAGGGSLTLTQQLAYVRIASFAGSPLLILTESAPTASELRVFRDSGAAAILVPASLPAPAFEEINAALRELPPRRTRQEGHEIALVPAASGDAHEHDDDDEDRL